MVNFNENFYASRAGDGQKRSHIPALPLWTAFVRVGQLALALLLLILTSYSASKLGSGVDGFGLTWWAFIWTVLYFAWLAVSTLFQTIAYHYWVHLAAESLSVIWWLCAWAVLASDASAFSPLEGYYSDLPYSSLNVPGIGNLGTYESDLNSAINCIKASAVLGVLEWLSFILTLVFLVFSILAHRKTEAAPAGTVGTEAAPAVVENKPAPAAELQQIPA